ncbi:extracellular solute-binding protein [Rhodovastum sp. RN2-1]|uniref:Extracellular solute-binding protein n=2 Tax=Limobrevibacterium gyesilva TaxID=2991712 RepID=A0AA41YNX3_9PROT|nr:extracellular solute-binding protein [Limobrevibacterium gyesilva]
MASAVGIGAAAITRRSVAAQPFTPSAGLVEAARKEGKMIYYTASFTEVEQEVINAFNKRFPFVRVEMVRASGGQLITRVKTEAAAGKLVADVVDHSDRGLMKALEHLFQDYAPPNASDYLPSALVSPRLWPRLTPGWSIAYNTELVKNPPKTWMDLTKPEYAKGQIGQVIGPSGGTTWTRIMFERQVLAEDYWKRQAATKPALYPSGAPLSDALVRGEVSIAPLIYNAILPKKRDGAPVEIFFPPEGVPIVPYATGIPKTSANPNAARLFLDWSLSPEGQAFTIKDQGNLTSLKEPPFNPEGFDPKVAKVWVPDFKQFVELHDKWLEEWNTVYGYRQ